MDGLLPEGGQMSRVELAESFRHSSNPLEVLEEVIHANDWSFERHGDGEMTIEIAGHWCTYQLYFVWQPSVNALFFSCHFDVRVAEAKRLEIYQLVARANERLWIGHFDFLSDDLTLIFRHTHSTLGLRECSTALFEEFIDAAINECERFYPALHLVLWGGQSADEALTVSFMETVGEA